MGEPHKPPTTNTKHYEKRIENSDFDKLHGHLAEAESVMAKYRQEDTTMLEFATVCEQFEQCMKLEFSAFAAIVERTKKGEQYNG